MGDKLKHTPTVRRHLTAPLAVPDERKGNWVSPGRIIGSSPWLAELWAKRAALNGKVKLIAWGMRDIAFREKELLRWAEAFPEARVVRYPEAGHFVPEECPDELAAELRAILAG